LFRPRNRPVGFDLYAIDIQRARDLSVPLCNDVRIAHGLEPIETWDDFDALNIGQDPEVIRNQLKSLYPTPYEADSYVCGLAENWVFTDETLAHNDYSNLGLLFEESIISQFERLIVGDRFWYSRNLDEINIDGLPDVSTRTLAQVIRDNAGKDIDIQDNVFRHDNVFF